MTLEVEDTPGLNLQLKVHTHTQTCILILVTSVLGVRIVLYMYQNAQNCARIVEPTGVIQAVNVI